MDIHAEGAGHFQGIDNVEVMRPGLGEILPGMRGSISADETFLPVGNSAIGVIDLQRLAVIHRLIAENIPTRLDETAVTNQNIPKIMADLMTKVTEQGAVGFVHGRAPLLSFGVVGF